MTPETVIWTGPTTLTSGGGQLRWDPGKQPDYHEQDLLAHEQLLADLAVLAALPKSKLATAVVERAHQSGTLSDHDAGAEPLALWASVGTMVQALLRLREPLLAGGRVMRAEVDALDEAVTQFNTAAGLDPVGQRAIPRPHVRREEDVADRLLLPDAPLGFGEPSPGRMLGQRWLPAARWAASISATGAVAEIPNRLMQRGDVRLQAIWAETGRPADISFTATNFQGVVGLAFVQSLSAVQLRCQGCRKPFHPTHGLQTWCDGPQCGPKGAARKRKKEQRDRELREQFR